MKTRIKELSANANPEAMKKFWSSLTPKQKATAVGIVVAIGTLPLWLWLFKGLTTIKSVPAVAGSVPGMFMYKVPASAAVKAATAGLYAATAGATVGYIAYGKFKADDFTKSFDDEQA